MFSNISAPLSWQWVRHNQTTELNSVKIQENTHARAHTHYKHQLAIAAVMLCNKETKTLKKRKQISMTLNNFLTPMGDNKRVLFSQGLVWKLGSATCLWFRLLGLQQLKRLSFIFQCFDSAVCVSRSPWINILSRNILPIAMKESQECLSKCVKPRLGCKKKKKKSQALNWDTLYLSINWPKHYTWLHPKSRGGTPSHITKGVDAGKNEEMWLTMETSMLHSTGYIPKNDI